MNKKTVFSLFLISIIIAIAGELIVLQKRPMPVVVAPPAPQPIATTTQLTQTPPAPQSPPAPPSTCNTSAGKVSTSTWKTFADPQWEITFQYPPSWKLEQSNTAGGELYLAISEAENLFVVVVNPSRSYLYEDGTYTSCNRMVAGKNIEITIDPYRHPSSTFRYVTSLSQKHTYVFDIRGPLSSAELMNAILNSIVLSNK